MIYIDASVTLVETLYRRHGTPIPSVWYHSGKKKEKKNKKQLHIPKPKRRSASIKPKSFRSKLTLAVTFKVPNYLTQVTR